MCANLLDKETFRRWQFTEALEGALSVVTANAALLRNRGFILNADLHELLTPGALLFGSGGRIALPSLILPHKERASAKSLLTLLTELRVCPFLTIPEHHKPWETKEPYVLLNPTGSLGLIPKVSEKTVDATADQHEAACKEALNPETSAWKNSPFFPDLLSKGSLDPELPQMGVEELLWATLWEYLLTGNTPIGGYYRAGKQSSTKGDQSLFVGFDVLGVDVFRVIASDTDTFCGCCPRVVSTLS